MRRLIPSCSLLGVVGASLDERAGPSCISFLAVQGDSNLLVIAPDMQVRLSANGKTKLHDATTVDPLEFSFKWKQVSITVASGFNDDDTEKINEVCKRLGIWCARNWDPTSEVLVVTEMKPTPKFMAAVIAQRKIVSAQYIFDLLESKDTFEHGLPPMRPEHCPPVSSLLKADDFCKHIELKGASTALP